MQNGSWAEVEDEIQNSREVMEEAEEKRLERHGVRAYKFSRSQARPRCLKFDIGLCERGRHCSHSHSYVPDIARRICPQLLRGECSRSNICAYSHNIQRYPCKYLHFLGSCPRDNCLFTHSSIDSYALEELYLDNEEFLLDVYQTDPSCLLSHVHQYITQHHTQLKNIKQKPEFYSDLPECFWLPRQQTQVKILQPKKEKPIVPCQPPPQLQPKTRGRKKGSKTSEQKKKNSIFSVRYISKNRPEIPEKLPTISPLHLFNSKHPQNLISLHNLQHKPEEKLRSSEQTLQKGEQLNQIDIQQPNEEDQDQFFKEILKV